MHPRTLPFLTLTLALALPLLAHAGDRQDCSGAPRWNSDARYKQGAKVWYHDGGNVYALYSCDKAECHGAGDNEPSSGHTWKRLGWCKDQPG
jgi:hypothetical protein